MVITNSLISVYYNVHFNNKFINNTSSLYLRQANDNASEKIESLISFSRTLIFGGNVKENVEFFTQNL